ncbi:hypothetical protein ACFVFH_14985 [Streptomyces sp. NPDC057697]|uniref:hypothetical protein n=1 Tax=Streptomyces sp. NPDC057697 TaxID=3346219 RepID=UPI00368222A2
MKRRTFLAGTTAVSVPAVTTATAMAAGPAAAASRSAATLRLVVDGVSHDLPPTSVYGTTIEATGTEGRARVTMTGKYSEFSVAFPSPYEPHLARVSVWLTGVTPKKGNLWLKIFDQDNEEWGTLASRVDPSGFDGRTRVTFEPQRLSRMTWSGVGDGRLTHPLRRLVLVFFPDDKQAADPFAFDLESVEVVGDGGPVSAWSRAGALERPVRARTRLVSGGSGGVTLRRGTRRPPAHRHTGRTSRGRYHQGGAGPRRVGRRAARPGRRGHRLGARRAARRPSGHRRRRERVARAGARRWHRLGDGPGRRHP